MLKPACKRNYCYAVFGAAAALWASGCSPRIQAPPSGIASALRPMTYADGTTVAGVRVGGLTEDAAGKAMRLALRPLASRPVHLSAGHKVYDRTWAQLGAKPDVQAMLARAWNESRVPLMVSLSLGEAKGSIRHAAYDYDVKPVAPHWTGDPGESQIAPGRAGRRVNIPVSAGLLRSALLKNPSVRHAALVTEVVHPYFSESDLREVQVPVARFQTFYNPGEAARTHNLRLVTARLNGAFVHPGNTFSFNDWVGERRADQGFEEAIVYKQGKMVKDVGGGLCQVSSTLYNVALVAGLPIRERTHHSLTVHYVPAGRDATVYWGQHDLRFTNDTDTPLYITAHAADGKLTIAAYGRQPLDRQVTVTSRSARHGDQLYAQVFRTISENGRKRHEMVSDDAYGTTHVMADAAPNARRA